MKAALKFLLDQMFDRAVLNRLRELGYDVWLYQKSVCQLLMIPR